MRYPNTTICFLVFCGVFLGKTASSSAVDRSLQRDPDASTNSASTVEQGLSQLEQTSQALTALLVRHQDDHQSPLQEMLTQAIGYTQQIQQMALQANADIRNKEEELQTHQSKRRQLASSQHARAKPHFDLHDALQSGDLGWMERRGPTAGRRLSEDGDDDEEEEGSDFECLALVHCLRDWTLTDVIHHFFLDKEGEIMEFEDDADPQELLQKQAQRLTKKLSVFPLDDAPTIDLGPKCNSLLSALPKSTTWKEVCRVDKETTATTGKWSLTDAQEVFGSTVARQLFEDFVLCSPESLRETVFQGDNETLRIPVELKEEEGESTLEYEDQPRVYDRLVESIGSDHVAEHASPDCQKQLDDVYATLFFQRVDPHLLLASDPARSLPDLVLDCNATVFVGGEQGSPFACRMVVEADDAGLDEDCRVRIAPEADLCADMERPTEGGILRCEEEVLKVESLFQGDASAWQEVARLLLGEEAGAGSPAGLVCPHKEEAPGFCCLDQPADDFTLGLWGDKFNCDLDESDCQNVAPLFSGFSEQTCSSLYNGTYCLKQTNCTELIDCIEEEQEWAQENDKMAYRDYLRAGPRVETIAQCGVLREYHGFAQDQKDQRVCSSIRQLRSHRAFEELDQLLTSDEPGTTRLSVGGLNLKLNIQNQREKNEEHIDAMELGDLDAFEKELEDPEEPEHGEEYLAAKKLGLYQFRQVLNTLEETLNVLEVYICASDPSFDAYNDCAATKNVMSAVLVSSLFISKRIYHAIEYFYLEDDAVSDFNLNEMYENVMKVHDNLGVLSSYAEVIRDNQQVLRDNQEVLSSQIRGITGEEALEKTTSGVTSSSKIEEKIDTTNSLITDVRVKLKADMVNLNQGTKLHIDLKNDVVLQKIEDTCAPAARRRLHTDCTGEDFSLRCGFDREGFKISEDRKSLFVAEGVRKVNTGFFYEVKGACSELADVSISVLSNEVDEKQSAFLTKVVSHGTAGELPLVYIAPKVCKDEEEDPCSADTVCEPSPSGSRFYDIEVTATDGVSGVTAHDVCRVIVLAKQQKAEVQNESHDGLTKQEERKLIEASPFRTVVGGLSLQSACK